MKAWFKLMHLFLRRICYCFCVIWGDIKEERGMEKEKGVMWGVNLSLAIIGARKVIINMCLFLSCWDL